MRTRILIVATDVAFRARLVGIMKGAGYAPELAEPAARAHLRNNRGVALALVAPEGLGPASDEVLRGLEDRIGHVVLVATPGRPAPPERAMHAEMIGGADEAGLLAALAGRLGHAPGEPPPLPVLAFGNLHLDRSAQLLLDVNGTEVRLTPGEFRLLSAFAERPSRVLSRETLHRVTLGEGDADRRIDMLVMRLRRRIERDHRRPALIITVPGSGYRFAARVETLDAMPAIATVTPPEAAPAAAQPPEPAIRRWVTILCAEIVPGRLPQDPEHYAALLSAHRAHVGAVAGQFGGTLGRGFHGAVPVYFGFPAALEHGGEQAVAAALAIVEADGPAPALRVGLAAGLVMAAPDGEIFGAPASAALALAARAARGEVLMDNEVRRAIGGLFRCHAMGPAPTSSGPAWRVIGRGRLHNRFRALRRDRIPIIGRAEELDMLHRRWAKAREGEGRVVLITGEAGIGKSRLVRAFAALSEDAGPLRLCLDCAPHQAGTALYPLIGLLTAPAKAGQARMAHLRRALRAADADEQDLGRLASLLGLADGAAEPGAAEPSPQGRKAGIFDTVRSLLVRLCARRPVMVLCEDMHWADSVSLELLEQVMRDVAELPALLVVTGRPQFSPGWADAPHVSTLKLNRLGRQDSACLAACVAGGQALPAELADPILARTEGVPLFVEEFTRTVLETGAAAQAMERFRLGIPLDIPGSLQESLMARLDRLGWARPLAQCAAALGSDFSGALLAAVAELAPARLEAGLALLIDAQLVSASGTGSSAAYRFRHALLRDAAYGSLPLPDRVRLHARIAAALALTIPGIAETNPEILAHHLTEAGERASAIPLWFQAGRKNLRASANLEAATHFRQALTLLANEEAGPQRESLELDIRVEFSVALTGTSGYTAPELRENTRRALAICEAQHNPARFYPVLWSLVAAAFSAGDVRNALQLAEKFLREAEQLHDRQLRMIGHRLCGMASFGAGALAEARMHLENALALHEPDNDTGLAAIYGFDQRVATLIYLAHVEQECGATAQALHIADRALDEARLTAHANTEIYVRSCLLLLHMARRDQVALAASVREAARVARHHAAYNLQVAAACLERILSLPASGAGDAFAAIHRHLEGLRQFNWIYLVTRINLFAAEMAAERGHAIEARVFCEEARTLIGSLGQSGCLAELHLAEAAVLRAEARSLVF